MVSVVIPTYNERENLQTLLPQLLYRFAASQTRAEVIVVDDTSPDGTAEIVQYYRRRFPHRLRLLSQPGKMGLGNAYRAGMKNALEHGADYVVQMDADGSHDHKDLARLLSPLAKKQADLVIGSRYVSGGDVQNWSLRRRLMSRGGAAYARTILQSRIRDITSGFRGWDRELLGKTLFTTTRSDGYAFQIEMARRAELAGGRIVELPITFTERRDGVSKLSREIVREAAVTPWKI